MGYYVGVWGIMLVYGVLCCYMGNMLVYGVICWYMGNMLERRSNVAQLSLFFWEDLHMICETSVYKLREGFGKKLGRTFFLQNYYVC